MAKKTISLPKCNLHLLGSGHDANGNKIVKLSFVNTRGFSIQTNGNLKKTGTILRGLKTYSDMKELSKRDLNTIAAEVVKYIKKYGSPKQKTKLKIYR